MSNLPSKMPCQKLTNSANSWVLAQSLSNPRKIRMMNNFDTQKANVLFSETQCPFTQD